MKKSAMWKWIGATIIAVTAALCAACAQPPSHPIHDNIERDAHLDGSWPGWYMV